MDAKILGLIMSSIYASDAYYAKYPYTLAVLKNKSEVLLLNRNKSPWMGCWNGLGGKLERGKDPNPVHGILRELGEEAGLASPAKEVTLKNCGIMEWHLLYDPDAPVKGMYIFLGEITDEVRSKYLSDTPKKFDEGVLDWKDLDWVLNEKNIGVVKNVRESLKWMISGEANENTVINAYFEAENVVKNIVLDKSQKNFE